VVNTQEDLDLIEQLLARQPVETMQRLACHFAPSALRRLGLAERDDRIRARAVGRVGTGRELARTLDRDLSRYCKGGFRFEPHRPPANPRRALMH
jgi:hypothetical protein